MKNKVFLSLYAIFFLLIAIPCFMPAFTDFSTYRLMQLIGVTGGKIMYYIWLLIIVLLPALITILSYVKQSTKYFYYITLPLEILNLILNTVYFIIFSPISSVKFAALYVFIVNLLLIACSIAAMHDYSTEKSLIKVTYKVSGSAAISFVYLLLLFPLFCFTLAVSDLVI